MRGAGGVHEGCGSAVCARVRLQNLREANERVALVNGTVTAGGEVVPCEFQQTSYRELLAMSLAERTEYLTSLPTLITGATDEWPAHREWRDPRAFSMAFGHHLLKATRARQGFSRLVALGGRTCLNFDESTCPGQANATISLAELVPFSDKEQIVIMDLPDMTLGEHELLTSLSASYEPPEFLEALSNVRLLSLGGRPEGVQMSRHHSAWLTTIAGAKLWHLAPPSKPKPADRFCHGRGRVDYDLAQREGVLHCMALPGETVVVPDNWWHATCNMLPYTLAIGGQTWDAAVQTPFAARSDAAKAALAKRWQQGTPRPLNGYQSLVLAEGLHDGERLPNSL